MVHHDLTWFNTMRMISISRKDNFTTSLSWSTSVIHDLTMFTTMNITSPSGSIMVHYDHLLIKTYPMVTTLAVLNERYGQKQWNTTENILVHHSLTRLSLCSSPFQDLPNGTYIDPIG